VKADTRAMAIRLAAAKTTESDLRQVQQLFTGAKGECPVTLILALPDGAEAVLALGKGHRVEVGDPLLSGLERIFGAQVAELR
jgi:DNA polymerase III subunit alpha